MKIRINSQDNLPLNRKLCLLTLDIIVESVVQIKNKCYLQIYLTDCEYEQ